MNPDLLASYTAAAAVAECLGTAASHVVTSADPAVIALRRDLGLLGSEFTPKFVAASAAHRKALAQARYARNEARLLEDFRDGSPGELPDGRQGCHDADDDRLVLW